MAIKNLLLGIYFIGTLNAGEQACCLDTNQEQFCYIGSLDFKIKTPEAKQLSLCYDGTIVCVNDGIYCFKENKDVSKFYILFVDPDAIKSISKHNEGNTINHLTFVSNTHYHFYRFNLIEESSSAYSWHVKRKPMPKKEIEGQLIVTIPDHTLIIPIDNQFFKKTEHNSILFTYKALKSNGSVIKLPTPIVSDYDKEQLKEALLKANLCMIHLANIHAKQETHEIQLDKHRLLMQ